MLSRTDKEVILRRFTALRHNPRFSDEAIRRNIRDFTKGLCGDEREISEILDKLFPKSRYPFPQKPSRLEREVNEIVDKLFPK